MKHSIKSGARSSEFGLVSGKDSVCHQSVCMKIDLHNNIVVIEALGMHIIYTCPNDNFFLKRSVNY